MTRDDGGEEGAGYHVVPPQGRRAIFLGDLTDRGPDSPGVLRLVMGMVADGSALCVPGNHDVKLLRKLNGKDVKVSNGLEKTLEQLAPEQPAFIEEVRRFLDSLISHYVLDDGRLVVAHAGLKESMQGRGSGAVREFCHYGETTGERDEYDLPVRLDWAAEYGGRAAVVYGHTPVGRPQWVNNTINIDTGCVFGGSLTALRYPELELVCVEAEETYAESPKPFLPEDIEEAGLSPQHILDDMLDLEDVFGKRVIETRLQRAVTIREGNSAAALEVMSRFAIDPKWLIYLPPTMSPPETSRREGLLEHPDEALAYYRERGVATVMCQHKHMGSRAVAVVCRHEGVARERFGVDAESLGVIYTRTGRAFFNDAETEAGVIERVVAAAEASGVWDELETDWLLLDCELMPWSAKAGALVRDQYAAVGSAGEGALAAAVEVLGSAAERLPGAVPLLDEYRGRAEETERYREAYRGYCWPVESVDDLRLAPFHVLASEGGTHTGRDHAWHMMMCERLADAGEPTIMASEHITVDVNDDGSVADAIRWWETYTATGGEGMVVKPMGFITDSPRGLVQPAIKCRGREYLRIIYGPHYTRPEHLERLRNRGLGRKRSLALREFALGIEGIERFVRREPLRRVHECSFGVLALESEPVDPRL